MATCKINFTEQQHPTAYLFYDTVIKEGVTCDEIDAGYRISNFDGKRCSSESEYSCEVGKGDGVVEPTEVYEYVLNKDEKYRGLIEKGFSRPLPWVLDDLNPSTTFDGQIREKVKKHIEKISSILNKQGIEKGSKVYNERMAIALFYLVSMPDKEVIKEKKQIFDELSTELENIGFGEYREFLRTDGGLGVNGDYSKEYTALEALKNEQGECTEKSKILFAVLRMAGLSPFFVYAEENSLPEIFKASIEQTTSSRIEYIDHLCIGLMSDGAIRLFDPTAINSNASFKRYFQLSLRQYMACDIANYGEIFNENNLYDNAIKELTEAIELDPNNPTAFLNRAQSYQNKNLTENAMKDIEASITINPGITLSYTLRGMLLFNEGKNDKALENFDKAIKIRSNAAEAHVGRGLILYKKEQYGEALKEFNIAIGLGTKLEEAYTRRGAIYAMNNENEKAKEDFSKAITLNPKSFIAHIQRGKILIIMEKFDGALEDYTAAIDIGGDADDLADAYFVRGLILMDKLKQKREEKQEYEIDVLLSARSDFSRSIELDKKHYKVYVSRGMTWEKTGHYMEAIADYTAAIELDQTNWELYAKRVNAYIEKVKISIMIAEYVEPNFQQLFEVISLARGDCSKVGELKPEKSDESDIVSECLNKLEMELLKMERGAGSE